MKRATYDFRPEPVVAIGNGNYFYHWDIQEEKMSDLHSGIDGEQAEEVTKYTCYEAAVIGEVTYDKCVEAVIRANYTQEEELALINKYNSYSNGITADSTIVEEYNTYLKYVADAKLMVKHDLDLEEKLKLAKDRKINEINVYDKSKAVNDFTYQGQSMWLSREDRLALTDRFTRELSAGVETTNLFYQGVAIAVTPQEGLDLVAAVSTYADECFDNTQKNIGKVMAAKTVDDVEAIDVTMGYPAKLNLVKP